MARPTQRNEARAALVLVEAGEIQGPFRPEWLRDRPDLQIGADVGIEVTTATVEKARAEDTRADMLIDLPFEEAEELQRSNRKKNDDLTLHEIPSTRRTSVGYAARGYDGQDATTARIISCIRKKQHKWETGYKEFPVRRLFVDVDDDLLGNPKHPFDARPVLEEAKQSVFDTVYVHLRPIHRKHFLYALRKSDARPAPPYELDAAAIGRIDQEADRLLPS